MDPRLDRLYLFFVLVFDFSNKKIQNSKIILGGVWVCNMHIYVQALAPMNICWGQKTGALLSSPFLKHGCSLNREIKVVACQPQQASSLPASVELEAAGLILFLCGFKLRPSFLLSQPSYLLNHLPRIPEYL